MILIKDKVTKIVHVIINFVKRKYKNKKEEKCHTCTILIKGHK